MVSRSQVLITSTNNFTMANNFILYITKNDTFNHLYAKICIQLCHEFIKKELINYFITQ